MPSFAPPGLAWPLDKGIDLVMQLHCKPSGKPELIKPQVAFYFTDEAPTNTPAQIALNSFSIDIPADSTNVTVEDNYTLPIDAAIIGVLPHSHYLGKRIEGFATLPNGKQAWHFLVPSWDFNWQGDYHYAQPTFLPKGSTLHMRLTFDNSTNNIRNPNQPPKRVQYGINTTDEMAELWVQVLPINQADAQTLAADYSKKGMQDIIAFNQYRLRQNAFDAKAFSNMAAAKLGQGRKQEAFADFKRALELNPNLDDAHYYIGLLNRMQGRNQQAMEEFQTAVRLNPENYKAHGNIGLLLVDSNPVVAEDHFNQALRINPNDPIAHDMIGVLCFNRGSLAEAKSHFEAALEANASDPEVRRHLAAVQRAMPK
jgi:tetratricopeptide (TPR) repeat protein